MELQGNEGKVFPIKNSGQLNIHVKKKNWPVLHTNNQFQGDHRSQVKTQHEAFKRILSWSEGREHFLSQRQKKLKKIKHITKVT